MGDLCDTRVSRRVQAYVYRPAQEVIDHQLAPYILAAPALLVIELEVYSPEVGINEQHEHRPEHEVGVVYSLIAALRPRLASQLHMTASSHGPGRLSYSCQQAALRERTAGLGAALLHVAQGGAAAVLSVQLLCSVVHRAELASWERAELHGLACRGGPRALE